MYKRQLLGKGETFVDWNSNVPDNNFPEFLKTQLQSACVALGVSYHYFTGDVSKTNFSSGRLGEIRTRNTWDYFRAMLTEEFLERVFERWFLFNSKDISGSRGGVNTEQAFKHTFVGAGYQHIQPREQAIASQIEISTMQKSVSELIIESGRNPGDVWREIKNEREEWKELGIAPQVILPPNTTDVDENADDESEGEEDDDNEPEPA